MKTFSLSLVTLVAALSAGTALPADRSVSLTQDPVVMRLNKDEFRIAFGIDGKQCAVTGCNGLIHYRVDWKTASGTQRSEMKQVSYSVAPQSGRTIAVDRQYFHTAEGDQMTDVVKVHVDKITCEDGIVARAL